MPSANFTGSGRNVSCFEPCGSHGAPWFCIWTKPTGESVALRELRNQNYPAFLPLFAKPLPNRQTKIEPLFLRYLFAQPVDGLWASMRNTRGVSDVIRDAAGRPKEVPTEIVAEIQSRSALDGIVHPDPAPRLTAGQSARVLVGPFTGFVGVCLEDSGDRVKMLMSLLGRGSPVFYLPRDLESIPCPV